MATIRMLVLGYGLTQEGELHPQTKARCWKALQFALEHQLKGDVIIFYITVAYRNMGDKMVKYLRSFGIQKERIILSPKGTGTKGEITIFLQNVSREDTLAVATSWYHIPRTRMLFRKLGRPEVVCVPAYGHVAWRADVFKEIWKYLNDLLDRRPLAWYKRVQTHK
jgi:uncharacterized SAM-binding protein YcdF (DUF218 family)